MYQRALAALSAVSIVFSLGCQSSAPEPPSSDAPTRVTKVTEGGFSSPTDAVASLDGSEFYFAALDESQAGAIYRTSSEPGSKAEKIVSGAPLVRPYGLVLSCDGRTLYISDVGDETDPAGKPGGLYSMDVESGKLTALAATGIGRSSGLAMNPDCKTLHASGTTANGLPALFAVPTGGGEASTLWMGAPLVAPTGLHVDFKGVTWQVDYQSTGGSTGSLYAITSDGSDPTQVMTNLRLGSPGGCSLIAGGGTAAITTLNAEGQGQITLVEIESGKVTQLAAPEIQKPAGVRSARDASILAVVDAAGAIFRAE